MARWAARVTKAARASAVAVVQRRAARLALPGRRPTRAGCRARRGGPLREMTYGSAPVTRAARSCRRRGMVLPRFVLLALHTSPYWTSCHVINFAA